jgi:ElaB/YqjD/DUF883 family membrane-anchored ribosome-binding protein
MGLHTFVERNKMSTTSERLGAQAKGLSDDLKEMGATVNDAAQEKLADLRESATEYGQQGRGNLNGVLCDFEQYVRARPLKSVLIAAGVGLLFGRFWRRR